MEGCFIGIDQGSSASKAVVVGSEGQVLFQARTELPPPFREGSRIEHDPSDVLRSVRNVLDDAVRAARDAGVPVLGIGLSCQRSSCLAWSGATGEPLTPVLSWRDTRGSDLVGGIHDQGPRIRRLSGLPLTPYYSASKLRWIRDHAAIGRTSDTVFGTLSSFLVRRLTGSGRNEIDATHAARTQLMNICTLAWDQDLLGIFGLAGIRLPEIVPSAHRHGSVRTPIGDTPLLAAIGDQQAAMLGLGMLAEGDAVINYGTGGFLLANTGRTLLPAEKLMASVLYSAETGSRFLLEGSVNAAGDALEWLRLHLGLFKEYREVDELCRKATTDTVAFIGLNGTGAPHWEENISSSFHGLTGKSTSADLVRAVVEGIAFFIMDIAEEVRKSGIGLKRTVLAGGLSSFTYLRQVQADILGADMLVSQGPEASAMGAAYLAGMQQGAWTDDDILRMVKNGETVQGRPNPGLERRYRIWRELHRITRELDGERNPQ